MSLFKRSARKSDEAVETLLPFYQQNGPLFLWKSPSRLKRTVSLWKRSIRPHSARIIISFLLLILPLLLLLRKSAHFDEDKYIALLRSLPIPSDTHISVVIMNHSRPKVLQESTLLPTLTSHPAISTIYLLHSNPETAFQYSHPKVQNVDVAQDNEKMGLSLRFYHCAETAKTDWVLIVDDDMECDRQAVDTLIQAMLLDPDRIVGHYGRAYHTFTAPTRHGYDTKTIYGPVEVVLTKFMILPRTLCGDFFHYHRVVQDLLPDSHPLWNGEDIFMSLVSNHVHASDKVNYAIRDLNVTEAAVTMKPGEEYGHDVSGNMDRHRLWKVGLDNYWTAVVKAQRHAYYRGKLWWTAKRRLAHMQY